MQPENAYNGFRLEKKRQVDLAKTFFFPQYRKLKREQIEKERNVGKV